MSFSGILQKPQVVFPAGPVASGMGNTTTDGLTACSTVLVDNDVLDWSWQLTVSLDILNHDQLTLPPLAHSSFSITVVDDEGMTTACSHLKGPMLVTHAYRLEDSIVF